MRLIGSIVLLQVQPRSLKVGGRLQRTYDPSAIRSVAALHLAPEGVTGTLDTDEVLIDIHHRDHPASKNRGSDNGISIGFTSHYERMRTRFGEHVVDGIAGENILVRGEEMVREADALAGLVIRTADGRQAHLTVIEAAEPCAEFSRFALGYAGDTPGDHRLTEALRFLRHGMRGFYAAYEGEPFLLQPGDQVFI